MQAPRYTPQELHLLPTQPGIYRFYNKPGLLIYVGKAKNIRNRVRSYFSNAKQHSLKTRHLVAEIASIELTIVNSEYEALLLENNLIKKSQPKYNILLKDGKSYPYICITKEHFPRVIATRKVAAHLGEYYGPFTDLKAMQRILELIKQLYPLRTCTYHLSPENIQKNKFKVCLEYHLGNCKGPCEGLQMEDTYLQDVAEVRHLLKGNFSAVRQRFSQQMQRAATARAYEEAQKHKEKLEALAAYQAKSLVINPKVGDLDVFGMVSDEQAAFISYLQIKSGAMTFTQTVEVKKKLEETEEDILSLVIVNFREQYRSTASEILCNLDVSDSFNQLPIAVPKIGDKLRLVEMALKNAFFFKQERFLRKAQQQPRQNRTLLLLQQDLQLKTVPLHIECFDNSNIQGSSPVSAMVCFRNGKPAKKEYRHFHIKTVTGPDDFASMREVVQRRYKRLVEEGSALPDLIVIDGGKGQLSAAAGALKEVGVYGKVSIIGIAKRLEELYYPEDPYPLHISKQSASLKLLQQLRNEAHRFAISFHRNQRSKKSLQSSLEQISGIGSKTIDKLLRHFKSVKNIREASLEDLTAQIGAAKASLLRAHLAGD